MERCELTVGQGKHQVWDRFCSRPTALVLSVGLWQTERWEQNVADFKKMVGDAEKQAESSGRGPLKIAVLLPYPVRKIRSPVPASGVQEDPNVEPQYTGTTMKGMRGESTSNLRLQKQSAVHCDF